MVRAYKQEHVYRHPWDRVTAASWRKFTDSPAVLSHVTDVHTLARRLDPGGGILRATRSITVRSPQLPFLLSRLIGQDSVLCHCVESTVVDAQARSMEIVIRNGSLRNLIEVEERSRYNPHPADPDRWTMFQQETSIRCRPLSALTAIAEKVEQRCAERFLQNSAKGREVIERICKYLEADSSSTSAAAGREKVPEPEGEDEIEAAHDQDKSPRCPLRRKKKNMASESVTTIVAGGVGGGEPH
ncbi:hypothetical protein Taro_002066 [Colocasia esculenta]|uniref:PRELI/MSF1 domain-containing protein n=1 Tax=Colocasia esculenta TaxID=4460 RepID=A0A843TI36_COLES|nr:hypothetical protein [Colocasia esculenta]